MDLLELVRAPGAGAASSQGRLRRPTPTRCPTSRRWFCSWILVENSFCAPRPEAALARPTSGCTWRRRIRSRSWASIRR